MAAGWHCLAWLIYCFFNNLRESNTAGEGVGFAGY
ncbi:hypothetical protein T08_9328 [Trichinella sp. T8]|nr:hypothetical protein T08_9328 [Trichinella sp. T8]